MLLLNKGLNKSWDPGLASPAQVVTPLLWGDSSDFYLLLEGKGINLMLPFYSYPVVV